MTSARHGHPAIAVPRTGQAEIRLPYSSDNGDYLAGAVGQARRSWDPVEKVWKLARHHANTLIGRLAHDYGRVTVIWEAKAGGERCDVRCQEARGLDCECSCLGQYHGSSAWGGDWLLVGDTTLVRPGDLVVLRREVTADPAPPLVYRDGDLVVANDGHGLTVRARVDSGVLLIDGWRFDRGGLRDVYSSELRIPLHGPQLGELLVEVGQLITGAAAPHHPGGTDDHIPA